MLLDNVVDKGVFNAIDQLNNRPEKYPGFKTPVRKLPSDAVIN